MPATVCQEGQIAAATSRSLPDQRRTVSRMIKLSVSYPKGEGTTFDHKYYAAIHIPLCNSTFSPTKTEVEKGIDGPNVAGVVFYFDSMDAMQSAMASPQMADVMADIVNYTNIAPVMQVSEIVS